MLKYNQYGFDYNALFSFGFQNFGAIDPDGIGIMTYGFVWPAPQRWTPNITEWGVTLTTWTQNAQEANVTLTTWTQIDGY